MKLSEIHINPDNPRIIKDDRFKKLVKSIKEFPKMMKLRLIIVDVEGMILGGNMRFKALKELGYKEVPDEWIKYDGELTAEEKQRFIIEDNVPFGDWDFDILANDWDQDKLIEWGLELPKDFGIKLDAVEDDYEIPDEIETDIVLGDLFEIGQHRLLCGDSTDSNQVAKLMDGKKANLVFTSPPYWVGKDYEYQKNEYEIDEFINAICDNILLNVENNYSRIVINTGTGMGTRVGENKSRIILLLDKWINNLHNNNWYLRSIRHWIKGGGNSVGIPISAKTDFVFSGMEYIMTFYNINGDNRGQNKINENWAQQSDWDDIAGDRQENKAGYPVELPSRFIKLYSKDNEIIMEPFGGNGTNWVASHQLNRKCYGMEIDPKYCQVILDRMRKLDPEIVIKKNGMLSDK